jgi:hypothetical protein
MPADPSPARGLVARAAWTGERSEADPVTLAVALDIARRNRVQGRLARAYPDLLDAEIERVADAHSAFLRNLDQASALVRDAGINPILIKVDPQEDAVYSNFDLVVGEDGWERAVRALSVWGRRNGRHPLEPGKLLIHPRVGPAAHLHRSVEWFGVPVIPTEILRSRASPRPGRPWWVPAAVDELRILLAHAAFQNLEIDLCDLLSLRRLLLGSSADLSREESRREGWGDAFDLALHVAQRAIEALDGGDVPPLPVPLPFGPSVLAGLRHGVRLVGGRDLPAGGRELLLRVPLVLAKRARRLR